jgi:TonB family protein
LYVADTGNRRIRKIANGTITTFAGDGNNRFGGDTGPALQASFIWPAALAFGPDRALYVLDAMDSRIRRIDPPSGTIRTVAGNGSHANSGDGGPALQAGLGAPEGLAFDAAGNLYLAEASGKIRKILAAARPPAPSNGASPGSGVYRVGNGVTAPALLRKVEPEYSQEALKAKIEGTVLLYVEITPAGRAGVIKVLHSLGLGLDEKAIEAVRTWTFQPGAKDGSPVTVASQIEVNFRLYKGPPDVPSQGQTAPPRQFTPPMAVSAQNDLVLPVSADRLETFLRAKLGAWTMEDARTVLGAVHIETGGQLTFETPGTSFSMVMLGFSAAGKLERVNCTPAAIVRWDRQLAYMKTRFPGDEFKAEQAGDNTVYTVASRRTSFTVQPDGTIVLMTIF